MAIRSQPFTRARAMMSLITSAMASTFGDRQELLAHIGEYRSRGHGRSRPAKAYHARSKYQPHQGVQEKLRREIGGWYDACATKRKSLLAMKEGS